MQDRAGLIHARLPHTQSIKVLIGAHVDMLERLQVCRDVPDRHRTELRNDGVADGLARMAWTVRLPSTKFSASSA
jgi:hypothetical protein